MKNIVVITAIIPVLFSIEVSANVSNTDSTLAKLIEYNSKIIEYNEELINQNAELIVKLDSIKADFDDLLLNTEIVVDNTQNIDTNTNEWQGFSTVISLIAIIASLVTVFGFVSILFEFINNYKSKKCKKVLIRDLIRHFFSNSSIIEVVRLNQGRFRFKGFLDPSIFKRLPTLEQDILFNNYYLDPDNYYLIHRISQKIRNYNVTSEIVSERFNRQDIDIEVKKADLLELLDRSSLICEGLIELLVIQERKNELRLKNTRCLRWIYNVIYKGQPNRKERFLKQEYLELEQYIRESYKVSEISWSGDKSSDIPSINISQSEGKYNDVDGRIFTKLGLYDLYVALIKDMLKKNTLRYINPGRGQ